MASRTPVRLVTHPAVVVLLFLVALLVGPVVWRAATAPSGPRLADVQSVAGRDFVSVSVAKFSQPVELLPGTSLTLRFGEASEFGLVASGGCSYYTFPGYWSGEGPKPTIMIDGEGRLHVDPANMGRTPGDCEPAVSRQDGMLYGVMTSSPRLVVDGPTLIMSSGDTVITMRQFN